MVYRCYTEKKKGFDGQASNLLHDLREYLGIKNLNSLRIFNRYDVEGIDDNVYKQARILVFSEPQCDNVYDEQLPYFPDGTVLLAVEALPGQFDQRADSCSQCIQMITCGERPLVSYACIYAFEGISQSDMPQIREYLINPVESREATFEKPATLKRMYTTPAPVGMIEGFITADKEGLKTLLTEYGLAMDLDDLQFMQKYFRDTEKREPSVTELKLVDTYWSDHCRHTTFSTHIDGVEIEDETVKQAYNRYLEARREVYGDAAEKRPQTLMDMATLGTKVLRKRGLLKNLDISEEINACSIHIDADIDGKTEDWLLMFKNETHNHPTEIEPFGGAATCIGGAIRDPLSGRAYVYQAMRVTGSGDPRAAIDETIEGKLPQRKLTTTAAAGYSSYGNQIGLATGLVHEVYHPNYVAKRMEVGAVVGAAPSKNVVRESPAPGDKIILLGGRTGRDGIGGATGSSKTHNKESLSTMASEVQKGNAPEERKIQRLFRNSEATLLIKRCNDFGAGGVSVAIGELADGLNIDLGAVRKKYEGLDGTEIAISESQERMAVVVAEKDVDKFIKLATDENLEAYVVAEVTKQPRMVMWLDGKKVADLSREFLSSNGADKHASVIVPKLNFARKTEYSGTLEENLTKLVTDLRVASQEGLGQRFDGSIGAGSVVMPFGGKTQLTPVQSMAALLPILNGETNTCSVMSFGFDPYHSELNTYSAAVTAVVSSVSKLVAAGCDPNKVYLSFQEYFERLGKQPERWGKPFSALLGALDAQLALGTAAIGGKDSMSGSFMDMDVPPTLISFAIAPAEADKLITPEFKKAGHFVCMYSVGKSLDQTKTMLETVYKQRDNIYAAWSVTEHGAMEGIFKMCIGNNIGFSAQEEMPLLFAENTGGIIVECDSPLPGSIVIGRTIEKSVIMSNNESVNLDELVCKWRSVLEDVFPMKTGDFEKIRPISSSRNCPIKSSAKIASPKAVIPVFPGTNCEFDTARAVERAGGTAEIVVIQNLNPSLLEDSVLRLENAIRRCQMLVIPGGFSGGDEPDGSGKFIAAFLRNPRITEAIHELLQKRDGLMLGICNGFQALIKLGLVPYGEIRPMTSDCPTLTFNTIGRHQSRYVNTRVCSTASPWLSRCNTGDVHTIPVSHGEGRFAASDEILQQLIKNDQIATQYCDEAGIPSMDISVNPNGSLAAIEGIFSPDGRVFGKMGHTERNGKYVAKNIYGNKFQPIFEGGVDYFK